MEDMARPLRGGDDSRSPLIGQGRGLQHTPSPMGRGHWPRGVGQPFQSTLRWTWSLLPRAGLEGSVRRGRRPIPQVLGVEIGGNPFSDGDGDAGGEADGDGDGGGVPHATKGGGDTESPREDHGTTDGMGADKDKSSACADVRVNIHVFCDLGMGDVKKVAFFTSLLRDLRLAASRLDVHLVDYSAAVLANFS